MSNMTEHEIWQWLLEQRLLHEAGALSQDKVDTLNQSIPTWATPVTSDDAAHALVTDHADLNRALELWWNATGKRGAPMTFAEIRVKAALES